MTPLSELPIAIASRLEGKNLIVFDGECVFCTGFFHFMLRHDCDHRFHYATAQSPLGQELYTSLGLASDDFETNLVVVDGVIYQRLDAFAAAMAELRLPWRALALCRQMPRGLKDAIYKPIARNRYRIWGRRATCLIPDAQTRTRFLGDGT